MFSVRLVACQIMPRFESAEAKNKLMRTVAGGGVEQMSNLQVRWDKFEMMMESHEMMMKDQVSQYLGDLIRIIILFMRQNHRNDPEVGTGIRGPTFMENVSFNLKEIQSSL